MLMTARKIQLKPRTLIVEDDLTSCSAAMKILRLRGYDVDCATTLMEGFEKLAVWSPSCIVLDLMLPDGNGLDLLKHIRDNDLNVRVAVTTAAADNVVSQAKALNADFLLRKPFDFSVLQKWLDTAA